MNANEVIATLASERLGEPGAVHPNDHVNASQSSNDVFPSRHPPRRRRGHRRRAHPGARASRAVARGARHAQFKTVVKSGRTHLMDATPVTLGQEFGGYAAQLERRRRAAARRAAPGRRSCRSAAPRWAPASTHPRPSPAVVVDGAGRHAPACPSPRRPTTSPPRGPATPWSSASGQVRTLAVRLVKIANDLRWMGCGPRTGLAEIRLPDLQPGSSIMPGKVNPVMAEAVTQVGGPGDGQRRRGRVRRVARATSSSTSTCRSSPATCSSRSGCWPPCAALFADRCIDGIEADEERCRTYAESSPVDRHLAHPVHRLREDRRHHQGVHQDRPLDPRHRDGGGPHDRRGARPGPRRPRPHQRGGCLSLFG